MAKGLTDKEGLGLSSKFEEGKLSKLLSLENDLYDCLVSMNENIAKLDAIESVEEKSYYIRDHILSNMDEMRGYVDKAEMSMPKDEWPFPTYVDLLFSVK